MSEAADADTVTDAAFCQVADPPLTEVGAVGAVRSMEISCVIHPDGLPAPSTARKPTSVCPSTLTVSAEPLTGVDQVAPASVDSRYS